jgi:type II secretory pathway component PulJ
MKVRFAPLSGSSQPRLGMSLVEVMVATAIGMMVLASVASLSLYGARSSLALNNYTDLDSKSRYALDVISRELRQATAVTDFQTTGTNSSLTLTNATQGVTVTVTYNANQRTVTMDKTGQQTLTNLTECDQWSVGLYQRTPWVTSTNVFFYPATNSSGAIDKSLCKLVSLSWKCSRSIMAQKVNTESVQAAQIVLRSKQ